MPCVVSLNGEIVPVPPTPPEPLPPEGADLPAGASCVTLTFQLCGNPGAGAPNQIQIEVFWSSDIGTSQETVLQQTATCGVFDTCFLVVNSPTVSSPDCIMWDLSLTIPAGKTDVQVETTEIGDPGNPGAVTVWVAFK